MRWGRPWTEERERWRAPQGSAWVRWFAWRPVKTEQPNDYWVWLEWVEYRYFEGMTFWLPEYRMLKKEPSK